MDKSVSSPKSNGLVQFHDNSGNCICWWRLCDTVESSAIKWTLKRLLLSKTFLWFVTWQLIQYYKNYLYVVSRGDSIQIYNTIIHSQTPTSKPCSSGTKHKLKQILRMTCNLKLLSKPDLVVWGLYRPLASEFTDNILRPANHLNTNQSPASFHQGSRCATTQ